MIKKCEKGKIVNPKSGRCVSKTGDIGIKLMINKNSSFKSVDSAILKSSSIHKPGRNIPLQMNLRDLTLLTQKPVNKTKFKGVTTIIYKCIKYLGEKHKDTVCVIKKNKIKSSDFVKKEDFAFVWNEETKKLFVPKTIFKEIEKCEKRFVVCYLSLKKPNSGHANILIFDRFNKTVERFDPLGEYMSGNLDTALMDEFRKNLGSFTYITPLDFCPTIAFQRKETKRDKLKNDPGGFCVAWSIWYADMRLTSPNIPRDQLVDIAINKIETKHKSFKNFIRNYSKFLVDKISRKSKKSSRKSVRKSVRKSKKSSRKSKKPSRKSVRKSKKSSRKSKKSSRKSVRKPKKPSRKSVRKSVRKSKKSSRKSKKPSRKSKKPSRKSKKPSRKSKKKKSF